MRHSAFFRFSAMAVISFYCSALAQAGQVITTNDKSWARETVKQEGKLGAISTSNSIAVLYFNNNTGQSKLDPLKKGLAVMLMTDLAKVDQIQVVERVRLQALLDEMDLGGSGLVEAGTASRIGQLLEAYYVTSGAIQQSRIKELEVAPVLLDVPFERLSTLPSVDASMDELFKLEKGILFNIIDQMKVSISTAKRIELEKPLSRSTAALLALFIGLDYSDKGQYAKAASMYDQALVEDPNLELAQSALQELKGMGLISSEEIGAAGEQPPVVPAEEGSSVGTVLGVGLALAAVGGVALAMSSSSGDDDNSSSSQNGTTVTAQNDTTPPTANANPQTGTGLSCYSGSVSFTFSKTMNTATGAASSSPKEFVTSRGWDGQIYSVSWKHDSQYCNYNGYGYSGPPELTVTLNGFQDTAGNALGGTAQFKYPVAE